MEELKIYQGGSEKKPKQERKLSQKAETGFVSPAADHLQKPLDLEELIVHHPTATFYVRAEGNAMKASGIHDGDILVVDRSLNPNDGTIVVAAIDEEPVIRRLIKRGGRLLLVSDDLKIKPYAINSDTNWMIWGVVTHVIHKYRHEH
ncbi:MAG TPA: peptidase S24 [Balneolaceae bacterium]|nr:peptidase S24 [Balneola sp.]HBQ61505.1 peptidase S24 [Balneolaceae bacterium]|tara:strand:- start:8582 stop:9022 length:441 start_codon:yes stop_codon:yes gene_type:complete